MTAPSMTPEERLFAVIQGKEHSPVQQRLKTPWRGEVGRRVRSLIGSLDLERGNQLLFVVAIVLGLWCVFNPVIMRPTIDAILKGSNAHLEPLVMASPVEGVKALEEYQQVLRIADPFRLASSSVSGPRGSTQDPSDLKTRLGDVHLVGISLGGTPTAMIEDRRAQRTQFVAQGDQVGELRVKEILDDRVILEHGSEQLELLLE